MSRVRMIFFLGLLWIVVLPPNSQAQTYQISTTTTTPSPEAIGCMIRNTGGEEYIGQASIAASGRTCIPWTNAPDCAQDLADKNQTLSRNFCRNPLQPDRCHRERPWCYTSYSFWEYCDVPVCDDPFRTCMTALGMGSGAISDSQITASSYLDTFYPFYARINGNTSVGQYWIPPSSGYLQYIHVDLLNPHRITKLYIQGSDGYYTYVEAFKVVYSLDGLIWKAYSETPDGTPKEFSGNHGSDVAPVYLKTPFTAVHVVIVPSILYRTPRLKLEIFGCLDVITVPTPTEITQDSQLDQSWSTQFSPYVIRRALNMPVYATLKLGSSVKIVFVGESSGLNLFGCLEINAADGFEVQMLSNNPLSQLSSLDENGRPFWQGISINAACSSELNHVTVVGANTGVYLGVSSPSYAISHLETKLCRTGVATKSRISIKDITFTECTFDQNDVGVYVSTNGSLNVSLCVFKGNNNALKLIPTSQSFQSITIRITKSKFLQNYQAIVNDQYLFCYMSNLDISIKESIFENHGGVAFDLSGYSCYAPTANIVIETCSFKNSRIALGLNAGAFNLSMTNSVISDVPQTWNTLTFRGRYQILLVTNTTFLNTSSVIVNTFPLESVTFQNNKFLSSRGTTCIYVTVGTSTEQPTGEIFLTANEFLNNSVSYVIRVNDLLNINTSLTENILDNPQSSYELYVTTPLKVNYALNAERNYWGGSNRSHVTSRIYDFYDNFQSAIVDIQSIYTDSQRTDLTDTHTWMEWNSSNVFNGGKLTRNETLSANSANNSCINITASIYIPPNFKLEISGEMTICIPRYVGITVGGSLILTGDDKPLIIRGSDNAEWGGVAFINSNGSSMWHTHLLNLENGVSFLGSSWNVSDSVLNISRGLFTTSLLPVTLSFYNTSIYCFDNTAINLESTNVTLQLRESAIRNQQYSSLNIRSSNLITMNARGTSFLSSIQLTSSSRLVANISHCQLKSGFSVNSYLASISTTGNNFSASSDCLYVYLYPGGIREINHLEIRQNYFRCGSRSLVVYDEWYSYGPTSVQFVQNVVDRGELFLQLYSPKSVGIAQNIFNGTDGLAANIDLRSSYYAVSPTDSNDAVWISNNAFKDRVGLVNSAVLSLSCLDYRSSIRLSDNTFANNSVNYVISSNCPGLYVTRNAFLNPKANYDYRTLVPYTPVNGLILYATGNFWNLSSYAEIAARILDQLDDSTLPSVELSPWFNDINRTVLGNFEAGFFRGSDYEIGGRLTENITLRNQGRPYIVEDDIIVPTEKTLFIEDGVQLIFKQGGITISGRLVALGNENSWTTMQPSDNSSFWKGITMQQPFFDEVLRHNDDWWEILYKGEWRTIEYFVNSDYMKNVAEVLCKQAGYDGSRDVSEYDCSSATTPNSVTDSNSNATTPNPKQSSMNPPCNDPTWRVSVICQEETFSINDCSIFDGYLYRKLAKISCLPPAVDKSTKTYRILSQLGGYLTYLSDNSLGVVDHELDEIFHVFIAKSPCLASGQSTDCVSLMPLGKPGWFVRHIGAENIILEPETNPSDSTTFDQDASFFIRHDAFLSGYISFESFNAPGSFIAMQTQNDSQQRLALTSVNGTDQDYNNAALSFRLIAFSKRKKRAVVTDYNSNPGFQSILRYVRISSANVGISIKGRAPTLESVIVERSKGNGIVYTGYASGNFSIASTTVSLSGGHGIRLEPSVNTFLCNICIRSCKLTDNADRGISFNGAVNVTVSNSIFTNNGLGIWIEMNDNNFGVNNTAIVRYSEFFSNQPNPSIYIYGNQLICHIHNNVLQNQRIANSEGSYVMQIYYCYAVISNNLFENSSYISYIFWTNAKTLEFRGNILRNNLARRVMFLENYNSIMNITGNDFIDNNFYYDSYTIYFRASTNTLFTGNVLSNNVNYELYFEELRQDDGRIFDISLNIWNKDSYSDVIKSIYCFYNDMNRIPVNIWPFIKDAKNLTLVPTPTDQDYFFENGIGGDVISNVTLPSQNESYAVERSIFVKQGTTLIVEEGTVLKFREGRGLFVKGNLILEGTAESPITFTSAYPIPSSANYWNGVVISLPSSSNLSAIAANVSHVIIEYNQNGALVVAPIIEISGFILRNTGAGLKVRGSNISVINSTFSTTYYALTIERWSQFQASESYAIVQGSVFNSSTRGVYSNLDFAAVRIVDSTFLGCDYGLSFTGTRSGDTNLIVENSTFVSNNLAIWMELYSGSNFTLSGSTIYGYFRSSYYDPGASGLYIYNLDWGSVLIQNNYFTNLSYSAVNIRSSSYSRPLGTITIGGNTFSRISKTALQIYSPLYSVTAIQNNTFTWNNFQTDSSAVAIQIYPFYTDKNYYPGNLTFTRNLIQENVGKYVASFICTTAIQPSTEARFPYFNVLSNVFRDNSPTDSLIYTEYNRLNINHNIFSVQPTGYTLRVGYSTNLSENGTFNWWATTDRDIVAQRIYDGHVDSTLGIVQYEPFLNQSEYSCDTVAGCSEHGICVFPEVCQCDLGWEESDCSQPSCAQVHNCLGRGECVGPNTCRCNEGYVNADCSGATCYERNNCSSRGLCVDQNVCLCAELYGGDNCSRCSQYRWGPTCSLCPNCVHGSCDQTTGACVCDGSNWAGALCNTCAPKFYGSACLPIIYIDRIIPQSGPDVGNTSVHFRGANFPNTTTYRCRFDSNVVAGLWLSDEDVLCLSPAHPAGQAAVDLSISEERGFLTPQLKYTYYPYCPASACGNQLTPPRGYCSMGSCICYLPWFDQDCGSLGLAPKIVSVLSQTILESQPFEITLNTSQGSEPFIWSLLEAPLGMSIKETAGVLRWTKAVAGPTPYNVTVSCRNVIDIDQATFTLRVPLSYSAVLDALPKGPFLTSQPVRIRGTVRWIVNNTFLVGQQIPVNILIRTATSIRTLSVITAYGINVFYSTFYPASYETGLFEADARHPLDPGFTAQQSWSVYGLSLLVNPSSFQGLTGNHTFPSFLTISNTGVDTLTFLQLTKIDLPFEMRFANQKISCVIAASTCFLSDVIQPGEKIVLNATVEGDRSGGVSFTITVSTAEGLIPYASVRFNFQQRTPVLTLKPGYIGATVARGNVYYFQINVSNDGLRPATNVSVRLPPSDMLSVISFGTNSSVAGRLLILETGDVATLVLQVRPSVQQEIGEVTGNILLTSVETSVSLSFRFVVSSLSTVNLTVSVEDEYTYFADNQPLVANSTVRLMPRFGGDTLTFTTGESGKVTFVNIPENYYTLYTSCERHLPDSRVIFVTGGSGSSVSVFLQRVAVTYSWVVTPITYEDRYDIKLEATFETHVPIPVVTVTPNKLDLDVLELGLTPYINFDITNYGLIAAKGFRFQLPSTDAHPFITFTMDREQVGDIAANSTVQVVVAVNIDEIKRQRYYNNDDNTVQKRSSDFFNNLMCLRLAIRALYYYICDHERYVDAQILLDRAISQTNCLSNNGVSRPSGPGGEVNFYPWDFSPSDGSGPTVNKGSIPITIPISCKRGVQCLEAIFDCFVKLVPPIDTAVCLLRYFLGGGPDQWQSLFNNDVENAAKVAVKEVIEIVICFPNPYKTLIDDWGCAQGVYKCVSWSDDRRRKRRSTVLTKEDLLPEYIRRYISVLQYSRLGDLIVNDSRWFGVDATDWWRSTVYNSLTEASDGGQYISVKEFNQAMSYPLPSNVTSDMAATLLRRINDSFVSWDGGMTSNSNGTISLEAFSDVAGVIYNDTEKAKKAGFDSPIDWFLDAADKMNEAAADTDEGVCATVRIQILQKLVLTRSAFSARLEIENGETEQLANIAVEIIITDHYSKASANSRFSIGRPEIAGMSGVDGRGVLNVNVKGSAQWLIAPYSTAAPTEDTQYDIGGTLYYTVNGENITVPLFPDTVTVKPDPRLYVYYFLEKYVYSDNPLTTDVVEPVVPFSLGILITNNGYGAASNLEITSAQPEIIDNEKGLLITIAIIGTQLGNSNVSPSLTINFGDILPHTTKLARWIMTSTLAGVFSNYSATFTNVNPLGDPQLSVLDSLKIFELLHVIRVDFPSDDDLVDFLTISTSRLDVLPDQIYLSDNGTSPLNVSVGNVTSLTIISSSQRQLVVVCSCTGWVYFRVEYPPSELSLSKVLRSDGRSVRVGDNIWVGKIKKANFLHLVDYIPASETQYQYNIQLSKINAQAAQFVEDVYYVNITEEEDPTYLLEVSVDSRNDDLTVTYSITEATLPFSIDASNGTLRTTAKLDRETQDRYSLVVIAVDNGSPSLTSTAIVAVSVIDINDNPPVFGFVPTDIYIEDITPLGYVLLQITVTDKDIGLNGIVTLSLVDLSDLFSLDATNNSLLTKEALNQKTGTYSLLIKAQDEGVPIQTSEVKVIVHVVSKDLHQPQFSSPHYIFSVNETKNSYEFVGRLIATDADNPNENLTYSVSQRFQSSGSCTLPFQVDSVSGVITNILELRSDSCSNYIFEVQVTDSGAPPTGPLSGRANVTVYVQDINDNAPEFPQSSYSVHIPENVYSETTLLTINATDKDFGQNGAIADYMLSQIYPQSSNITKFKLTVDAGAAVIKAVQPLDRELQARYLLQLVAVDGGQPPLSSNATTIEVIVDDVNDNSPIFINTTATVTIPRNIPVNTILYTVSATDADTGNNAIVRYLLVNSSQYINVQPDSGNVILVGSLQGTDITSIDLSIRATDGQLTSNATFQLRVFISDRNIYAPRFDSHEYRINVNESTPSGSSILRLTATDQDSPILYYFIIDGNDGNRFRVDSSTGVFRVLGEVNNRLVPFYNLTVRVNDSDTGGPDTLFDMANVYITITRLNRYSPVFAPGPTIQIRITEGTTSPNLTQLTATDQDGDNITYSLVNATGSQSFDVDPYSGWISVIVPLHREPSTQRMIQVTATDNGVPPRQSTVDIIVVVDPANVESTAMSPLNSSQGVTSQFYPATFETTTIHGSLAPTILSSAVSKSNLQNVTTTAGNGQRTATNLGGQQTITAEDGQRTTTQLGGQQTIATGDSQRTTTQLGEQQTIATGNGQRTETQLGGQQTIATGDGQRTTTRLGGQQTIATGDGQRTTTRLGGQQTIATGDGQRTTTHLGGQQTIATGGGQRTTTQLGGQQTIATGDGQRTTTRLGGQQTIAIGDGQRTTTRLDGQQTITTGNGQKTTTHQTVISPDGQSTATIPGGQETISGVAVIVIVVVSVVVLTVVVVVASCIFFRF